MEGNLEVVIDKLITIRNTTAIDNLYIWAAL